MKQNLVHILKENNLNIDISNRYKIHIFSQIIKNYNHVIINWSLDYICESPLFSYNTIKQTNNKDIIQHLGKIHTKHGLVNIYVDYSNYLDMNEFECTDDINKLINKIKNKLRKEKINRLINLNEKTIEKKETIIKKKSLIKRIINNLKF